jgi:hypothetical protein
LFLPNNDPFTLQLPDEAKELDKKLRQITKDKNEAVRGQDFEKVYIDFVVVLRVLDKVS